MARPPRLLDAHGRPVERRVLTQEIAAPTLGGIRSPLPGTPADALDPVRLAAILREADQGQPLRYLELAEIIEERDPHYLAVLSTRKRAVSQIEISVEAASDAAADVAAADMVREWLRRDELTREVFDILDCLGKGYSLTEIMWSTEGGRWWPERLEWRDPRWFRFDRRDLETPLLLDEHGAEIPLPWGKFVYARIQAKSGLPLRGGLARLAAWGWMFKAFTARDWAIFTQTYGQPLRLGKYGAGASEDDKETLFRAVANIAGDCAAIIPESMSIEFIETANIAGSIDLYERRVNHLDQQISKAVLGQTTSTDAISGGHAVSQEHRLVQEDIERADARALAACLNRDLVRPWMQLAFGPMARYPRIVIARPEAEDLGALAEAMAKMVPLGLRVQASEVRDRFGLAEPEDGAEVLGGPPPAPPGVGPRAAPPAADPAADDPAGAEADDAAAARQAAEPPAPPPDSPAGRHVDALADRAMVEVQPHVLTMLEAIEAMLATAGSLEEFREMLLAAYPRLDTDRLTGALEQAFVASEAAGRLALEDESA